MSKLDIIATVPMLSADILLESGHPMKIQISEDVPYGYGVAMCSSCFEEGKKLSAKDLQTIGETLAALGEKAHQRETLRRLMR